MRAKRGICGRAWREEIEEGKRGVCDKVWRERKKNLLFMTQTLFYFFIIPQVSLVDQLVYPIKTTAL